MEKHKPHYLLKAIQAQMNTLIAMNLTLSAHAGIRAAGMAQADALAVVQGWVHSKVVDSKQKPLSPRGRGVGERG